MNASIFCIANTIPQAETIIERLRAAGFSNNDISALLPDKSSTREFAHEHNTKAPDGATAGAVIGAGAGGIIGWLAGIGSLAIPGVGALIAAGPLMGALSAAAVGGATAGLVGALVGMGIPEFEAKRYQEKLTSGNILISVHTEDSRQRDLARKIFEEQGAQNIATSREPAAVD